MTNNLITSETFVINMPAGVELGFDPDSAAFSWRDVLPSNYWNLDLLEEKTAALGGNPVVTPKRIVIEPVVDPEVPEAAQDKSPKIVLEFTENVPALVFNKTRCMLATRMTGTTNPALWVERLPQLELYAGAYRDMAAAVQILFLPVTERPVNGATRAKGVDIDDVNDELFG